MLYESIVKDMQALIVKGQAQNALAVSQQAGDPQSRELSLLRGIAYKQLEQTETAKAALLESSRLDPDYPLPLYHLAHIAFNAADYVGTLEWVNKYQEYRPYSSDAFNWKVFSLKELGRLDELEAEIGRYGKVFPHTPTTLQAKILLSGEKNQSIDTLLMAGRLPSKRLHNTMFGHAIFACWHRLGRKDLAAQTLAHVYAGVSPETDGDCAEALGDLNFLCDELPSAVDYYRKARAAGFTDDISYLNEALALWSMGDFATGNKVYRHRSTHLKHLYLDGIPEWQGESLEDKTLLVHSEQGCGDVIQFIRYLPYLHSKAKTVLFNTYPDILSLLRADDNIQQVQGLSEEDLLLQIDFQICMMDVPGYLHPDGIAALNPEVPYLFPNRQKTEDWQQRLADYPGIKIGLVWAGNPIHTNDANRSASLAEWADLRTLSGISWFSVQKGQGTPEAAYPPQGWNITDLASDINDFSDTAAILANLDLLISIDTSVAHLAGACDLPVWVMLPSVGMDWRWRSQGETPQWYKSMRLLCQQGEENWANLIQREVIPRLIKMGASRQEQPLHLANPYKEIEEALADKQKQITDARLTELLEQDENDPRLNLLAAEFAYRAGRKSQADTYLDRVLKIQPRNVRAHLLKQHCAEKNQQHVANRHLEIALRLDRYNEEAWRAAASLFINEYAPIIARQIQENLYTRNRSLENALLLAASLARLGDEAGADAIVKNHPIAPDTLQPANLATAFHIFTRLEYKAEAYAVATRLHSEFPEDTYIQLLLGTRFLIWGDFEKGWQHYDKGYWPPPKEAPASLPEWNMEPIAGKRLLIHQDQGYGDVIQFLPLLHALPKDAAISVAVFTELLELLTGQNLPTNIQLISIDQLANMSAADFDLSIGFMHMVARLKPNLEHPAHTSPFLKLEANRLTQWVAHTQADPHLKVGIVWAGNPLHFNDFNRSTCLQDWLCLTEIPSISWYNLQRDNASNQAYEAPQFNFNNIVLDCQRLSDTAAAIAMLDLVITVDSALAHVAGAMGKECWVLLPYINTDFRWQLEHEHCPWYPTLRLIRQQAHESWHDTLQRLRPSLAERASRQEK